MKHPAFDLNGNSSPRTTPFAENSKDWTLPIEPLLAVSNAPDV
jgi:hypothetical protein